MVNLTTLRIQKLLDRGDHTCEQIARKIGRPGDIRRVHKVGCRVLIDLARAEENVKVEPTNGR